MRMDIVGKLTPNDVASGGLRPPSRHLRRACVSSSVDLIERLALFGTRFLICRTCATDSGPSSWLLLGENLGSEIMQRAMNYLSFIYPQILSQPLRGVAGYAGRAIH